MQGTLLILINLKYILILNLNYSTNNNDVHIGRININHFNIAFQPGHFRCTSGHCIQEHFHCDGDRDCRDLSDELTCPPRYPNNRYCADDEFECDNHLCVSIRDLCDGNSDCYDNSDEREEICSKLLLQTL